MAWDLEWTVFLPRGRDFVQARQTIGKGMGVIVG